MQRILITGGSGFIGATLVRLFLRCNMYVLNLDKLTYAGQHSSIPSVSQLPHYTFVLGDICDEHLLDKIFSEFQPDSVVHCAAESHVDRSITSPEIFIETNIIGTYRILEATNTYLKNHPKKKSTFRLHHISTDEVFGSLGSEGIFTEKSPYRPNSPYAASKASADHLVRAWHQTNDIPVTISFCSNNYGPYQYPEKLIPMSVISALENKKIYLYGSGRNIRDWIHVEDHATAIQCILDKGVIGETYNVGASTEKTNLEIAHGIIQILEDKDISIELIKDRPGHDFRYALDASKLRDTLGWKPAKNFENGLRETVEWYRNNKKWWGSLVASPYPKPKRGS